MLSSPSFFGRLLRLDGLRNEAQPPLLAWSASVRASTSMAAFSSQSCPLPKRLGDEPTSTRVGDTG